MGLIFFVVFTEKVIHWFNESNCSNLIQVQKSYSLKFSTAHDHLSKKSTTPFYLCVITFVKKVKQRSTASPGLHQKNQTKIYF